jgi:hypothetical protein
MNGRKHTYPWTWELMRGGLPTHCDSGWTLRMRIRPNSRRPGGSMVNRAANVQPLERYVVVGEHISFWLNLHGSG